MESRKSLHGRAKALRKRIRRSIRDWHIPMKDIVLMQQKHEVLWDKIYPDECEAESAQFTLESRSRFNYFTRRINVTYENYRQSAAQFYASLNKRRS